MYMHIYRYLYTHMHIHIKVLTHMCTQMHTHTLITHGMYVFINRVDEEAFQVVSLLIILRLWRIVRVVNGIVLTTTARRDAAVHEARGEARRIIHILHKTQNRLVEEMV